MLRQRQCKAKRSTHWEHKAARSNLKRDTTNICNTFCRSLVLKLARAMCTGLPIGQTRQGNTNANLRSTRPLRLPWLAFQILLTASATNFFTINRVIEPSTRAPCQADTTCSSEKCVLKRLLHTSRRIGTSVERAIFAENGFLASKPIFADLLRCIIVIQFKKDDDTSALHRHPLLIRLHCLHQGLGRRDCM